MKKIDLKLAIILLLDLLKILMLFGDTIKLFFLETTPYFSVSLKSKLY
jgi:hypothetical protein